MDILKTGKPLAGLFCLSVLLASPGMSQLPLGSLYTENLPGGFDLPAGTFDIGQKMREVTARAELRGMVRLPNGHYLFRAGSNFDGFNLVELDANLAIVRTLPYSGLFQMGQSMSIDKRSGPESRVWSQISNLVNSIDWRTLTFDAPFVIGSPYGFRFLEECLDCETYVGMTIADVDGQSVMVSAGQFPGSKFHYHSIGGDAGTLPEFQPPVAETFTPVGSIKGNAAYDPIRGTVWWSNLDLDQLAPDPFRFIEYDLAGQLTGRILQPGLPFGPLKINGSTEIGDADMFLDANGNRVLAFTYNHAGRNIFAEVNADFVYGAGCNGEIDFVGEPRIGASFDIELLSATPGAGDLAILWRGPMGLDSILSIPGLSNCSLHLVPNPALATVGTALIESGHASVTQRVPLNTGLVGLPLGLQWLIPSEPSVIPLDLSPAGGLRIGAAR